MAAAAPAADTDVSAAIAAAAGGGDADAGRAIEVDPMLTCWLRPHQRDGVQFMFDCVCGLRLQGGQGKGVHCDRLRSSTPAGASRMILFKLWRSCGPVLARCAAQ